MIEWIIKQIDELKRRLANMETREIPRWKYLTTPLTSTDWTLDTFSTTAKTKITLSTAFSGCPTNIKAVDVMVNLRDAASIANYAYLILSPNDTAGSGVIFKADRGVDDELSPHSAIIPCDGDGNIYYQTVCSAAGSMDITIQILGYLL